MLNAPVEDPKPNTFVKHPPNPQLNEPYFDYLGFALGGGV